MNYLVDTHIFLWAELSPRKISKSIKDILLDVERTKYVSVISFWEISLKFSLGKIDLKGVSPGNLPDIAQETGFEILNFDSQTASTFHQLPKLPHKDPFDRMLAWQAIKENCTLLTADKEFLNYKKHKLKVIL